MFLDLILLLHCALFVTSTEYICHDTYNDGFIRIHGRSNVTIFPPKAFACHPHVPVSIRLGPRQNGCRFTDAIFQSISSNENG